MDRIPVRGPSITQLEIDYVTNAWYGSANTYHARFESAFVSYVGRKVAMALPSATSARHSRLLALGVGRPVSTSRSTLCLALARHYCESSQSRAYVREDERGREARE